MNKLIITNLTELTWPGHVRGYISRAPRAALDLHSAICMHAPQSCSPVTKLDQRRSALRGAYRMQIKHARRASDPFYDYLHPKSDQDIICLSARAARIAQRGVRSLRRTSTDDHQRTCVPGLARQKIRCRERVYPAI